MQSTRFRTTGFTLKVLAILGMTANHVAHVFSMMLPWQAVAVLYSFGGLTYPIMAYLIVEGYLHTSNLRKYATRLFVFALVSQVPFWLCFGWPHLPTADDGGLNLDVFFTLLIGLGMLWAWNRFAGERWKFALVAVAGVALSYFCDWALQGPIIVLLFYVLRERGVAGVWLTMLLPYTLTLLPVLAELPASLAVGFTAGANAVDFDLADSYVMLDIAGRPLLLRNDTFLYVCNAGYALVGFTLAALLICRYDGRRGRPMKWLFYVFYPLHLLVIWGIHQALLVL